MTDEEIIVVGHAIAALAKVEFKLANVVTKLLYEYAKFIGEKK